MTQGDSAFDAGSAPQGAAAVGAVTNSSNALGHGIVEGPSTSVGETASTSAQRLLSTMVERLLGAMANGPAMNCRPHSSRQRIDLTQLARLADQSPSMVLRELLGPNANVRVQANVQPLPASVLARARANDHRRRGRKEEKPQLGWGEPPLPAVDEMTVNPDSNLAAEAADAHRRGDENATRDAAASDENHKGPPEEADPLTPQQRAAIQAWDQQQTVLNKLRAIAEDARAYEQDTGVPALALGFPLLSLPAASGGGGGRGFSTRRILAPVAFLPLSLLVRTGPRTSVDLACRGEGADRVHANDTLLVWLAQRAGKMAGDAEVELFEDPEGEDPWRELRELVRHVAGLVGAGVPTLFEEEAPPNLVELVAAPTAEEADEWAKPTIVLGAVLGLYPTANQGLLRDAQAMAAGEQLHGPVRSFVYLGERLGEDDRTDVAGRPGARDFNTERLIAPCDPCQMRAVRLARASRGLVVHGPPGTGKSQTITNVIADHTSRGERVLFVCDKRTALDVVYNRLDHLGLGQLCALIHDPQRDRSDFYRNVRDQLEVLHEKKLHPRAAKRLEQIDEELARLHVELTDYHAALLKVHANADPAMSLHDLIGRWLESEEPVKLGDENASLAVEALAGIRPSQLAAALESTRDALERGRLADWPANPWREAAGWTLAELLARPMDDVRRRLDAICAMAEAADATRHESIPSFDLTVPLIQQANSRVLLAQRLAGLPTVGAESTAAARITRPAPELAAARASIAQVQAHAAFVRNNGLPEAVLLERAPNTSAAEASQHRDALKKYLEAFGATASRLSAAETAVRAVMDTDAQGRSIALYWLSAGEAARDKARRQLDAARSFTSMIETGTPDASMMRQYLRQPFGAAELLQRRAAVAEYESAGGGLLGFLAFRKKKAAAPTLQFFGLGVDVASAKQVRQFLDDLRTRVDLREVLDEALPESLRPAGLDDEVLLRTFRAHHAALTAFAAVPALDARTAGGAEVADAIHPVIATAVTAVRPAVEAVGLSVSPADADRALRFYTAVVALSGLRSVQRKLLPEAKASDAALPDVLAHLDALLTIAEWLLPTPGGQVLIEPLAAAIRAGALEAFVDGMKRSAPRVEAITALDAELATDGIIAERWRRQLDQMQRRGEAAIAPVTALRVQAKQLEAILRVGEYLRNASPALAAATSALLDARIDSAAGLAVLRKQTDAGEIRRRLASMPQLQSADAKRLRDAFERYRTLQGEKYGVVRDAILHDWTKRQKERLLAASGNRLNGFGADLRRRLAIRGKKMMRLRQMVRAGQGVEGGDPLFDICPVWMASPETVAQVFPREPTFDVVIFDEASQVRLEESLPVLTRARRLLVAGDPKQLPPTRFFESGVAISEDVGAETDQALFEQQQAETEDLLGAALGLDIQQCFLDVHYRSRNADLIGFSNEQFYGSRLQPIPGHPRNRTLYAPVRLYEVGGVYEDRQNELEAGQVVQIVRDLLKWAEPPSIGIACFNLSQRDLILEKLDEAAAADASFGRRFAAARERRGEGSFEGLFVKNLENVQGDERDHMIISTTYGPGPDGKFRRNFGPVSQSGGGRRLNVLVTRARSEVHLVTSIPPTEYRQLPPVPEGQQPTGRWLLYAYLHYAEQLRSLYEQDLEAPGDEARTDVTGDTSVDEAAPLRGTASNPLSSVSIRETQSPSRFAEALAKRLLAARGIGSEVYWGNEGFGIDIVLKAGSAPGTPLFAGDTTAGETVTVGVLCDLSRFAGTDDPIEWEAFRTSVHESQGWPLSRAWTPHAFRDPAGVAEMIADAHARVPRSET